MLLLPKIIILTF